MFTAPGVDQILHCQSIMSQKSWKPHAEIAPNCPRCASSNTKFCYYNNYSLSQPRYFCKGCRRYWTKGGSLRNVPVGGGCRKTRRTRSSRLSQPDRLSSSACYTHNNSSSEEPSWEGGTNGSDIDLAVVFAKFLNNHHDRDPNAVSSELMRDDDDDDHDENAFSVQSQVSSQRAAEDLLESVELLEELVLPDHDLPQQVQVDDNIHSFMGNQHHHDMSINHQFGLQGLLGNEDWVQDVFWSEATANNLTSTSPCFTWQELDNSFPSDDDDTKISAANMCDDNWSSFDFSGFEVFSRS